MRLYAPGDRDAVRRICFETGYMGDPVAWQWADPESFADLFTSWYTDHEPESAFVAESEGRVVGYLLGCRDTRRVQSAVRTMGRHLRRGVLVRPGTAGVLWRSMADIARDTLRAEAVPTGFVDDRWPAHLHIDLLPEARAAGVGRELITRWLDVLDTGGIPGCHLEIWAENDDAIAFFGRLGFARWGPPMPMPGIRSPEGHRHHTQVMVRSLRTGSEATAHRRATDERTSHQMSTEGSPSETADP